MCLQKLSAVHWAKNGQLQHSLTFNSMDNYIGLYDDKNQLAYAFNFTDLPNWGNIGALQIGK